MAVMDDLIASGLSLPQANAVVLEEFTGDARDALVAAGFTFSQAESMHAYNLSKTADNLDAITKQGIWAGTQLPAIDATLDLIP